ncbi:MAG: NADH-quinone oxidoreductase subunit L [Verrucomicrobia bacterium]|nr:NADH-quinone oxidoreductase subunit L [Verrucomicrobiota bacterium]
MNPWNHDVAKDEKDLVDVQVDGVWMQMPRGLNVVEVAHRAKKFIPHYCYHPKLSVVGNCRMCLFEMGTPKMGPDRKPVLGADGKPEIAWMPRPQIGCATGITPGMGIRTDSALVKDCRNGVMEFLLINHPLDCPICDQAGECKLQEFSVEYGSGASRFTENKVKKPKNVDLGKRIVLDDERCILCSRCVRFSSEVTQDNVLGFVNRGSHSTLTAYPGKSFDNDYSLNTVDICPVGALTSKDFRFQMRVWFLKESKSICTSCGTGCNITVGSREGKVHRLTPRENEAVNSHWMCDHGRLNFHYLDSKDRLTRPLLRAAGEQFPGTWEDAMARAAEGLKKAKPQEVAIVASGRLTNEELFVLKRLVGELGVTQVDLVPHAESGDKFLRSPDGNPNSLGVELLGLSSGGRNLGGWSAAILSGKIKALLVLGGEDLVAAGIPASVLGQLETLIFSGILSNETSRLAQVVLPAAGFAEKTGSMINVHGRLQRMTRAIATPGEAREDWMILRDLRMALTGGNSLHSVEDVWKAMSAEVPQFHGLSWAKIGDLGIQMETSSKTLECSKS